MTNKEKTARQMERYRNDPEYRAIILARKRQYRVLPRYKAKAIACVKHPKHRLATNIRNRIDKKLDSMGMAPFKGKLCDILKCSLSDLRRRFETLFRDGMNWDNYGEHWEIDHITPIATASDRQSLLDLNHFSNLQPLLVGENSQKGASIGGGRFFRGGNGAGG